MEVALLDILAVIRLARHEAEVALLENGVLLVPERERPAEDLIAITEAGDAVLAPAERLRSRQIVREVRPRIAVRAVILAHRSPGAVGEVRPPLAPARNVVRSAGQAIAFGGHRVTSDGTPGGLPSPPRTCRGMCP